LPTTVDFGEGDGRGKEGSTEEFTYFQEWFETRSEDAGAVLWDEYGRAVGLLCSGVQRLQQVADRMIAYVTPIHDVFEDIKRFSGGEVLDVRIVEGGEG